MIPKIIHYCWFGGKDIPQEQIEYMKSWEKYCPDYQIMRWDEESFDLKQNTYVKEAYEAKKWAFVTDYVRLYAMVTYGGIYMDTDVEVVKSLDAFLDEKAFSGFEDERSVPTGIMASEKGFPFFKELLKDYDGAHFVREDGSYDMTTNVDLITRKCVQNGLELNNKLQRVNEFALYPNDYFCPKDHHTGIINKTKNTYTIHHFAGTWVEPRAKKWEEMVKGLYSSKLWRKITRTLVFKTIRALYIEGVKGVVRRAKNYIHIK